MAEVLLEEQIPFSTNSRRIPLFKRLKYHGANTEWVITINPDRYRQARRVVDHMDSFYRERLVLTNF
jgi:hypothetical protein